METDGPSSDCGREVRRLWSEAGYSEASDDPLQHTLHALSSTLYNPESSADTEDSTPVAAVKFLTTRQIDELADPTWLVPDMIPVGSLSVLYGPPGVGKSFLAIDLALSLATGLAFLGMPLPQQGRTAYIVAEGLYTIKQRQKAWTTDRAMSLPKGVHYLGEPVNLYEEDHVQQFLYQARKIAPLDLVVVDTLARCMAGVDEDRAGFGKAVSGAEEIRRTTRAAVLLVHHSQRPTMDQPNLHARGHTLLEGAADVMVQLEPGKDKIITLSCTKMRMAPAFDPIHLRLKSVGESAVLDIASPQGERHRVLY